MLLACVRTSVLACAICKCNLYVLLACATCTCFLHELLAFNTSKWFLMVLLGCAICKFFLQVLLECAAGMCYYVSFLHVLIPCACMCLSRKLLTLHGYLRATHTYYLHRLLARPAYMHYINIDNKNKRLIEY
jgi:hypothetical protein